MTIVLLLLLLLLLLHVLPLYACAGDYRSAARRPAGEGAATGAGERRAAPRSGGEERGCECVSACKKWSMMDRLKEWQHLPNTLALVMMRSSW